MEGLSLPLVAVVACAMFLGALVKGAIGFGLPPVVLPILAFVLPPQTAMALLAVPIMGSNLIQAWQGGGWRPAIARFWPLLAGAIAGLAFGVQLLSRAGTAELHVLIGLTISALAIVQLAGLRLPRPRPPAEPATSAGIGLLAGVLGGMTSMFGPATITYLVALRLDKDLFVSALAVFYMVASTPFFVSLAFLGILGPGEFAASAAAMIPIVAGIAAGTALRRRIAPAFFRRVVLGALLVIGIVMVAKALGDL